MKTTQQMVQDVAAEIAKQGGDGTLVVVIVSHPRDAGIRIGAWVPSTRVLQQMIACVLEELRAGTATIVDNRTPPFDPTKAS